MAFAGRLFRDDDAPEPDWHQCKLREIFDLWFVPKVLRSRLRRIRPVTEATLRQYRESLAWWEATTDNPPAREINDDRLEAFLLGLDGASYRRGPISASRKLSDSTRKKHVRHIRTILDRLYVGASKPRIEILDERAPLPSSKIAYMPKPTPDFETFKAIFGKLESAVSLRLCAPEGVEPVYFWRALLATLYCHGWRLQTALALDWRWFEAGTVNRLNVPGEANLKTHKAAMRPVPDWLLKHWTRQNIRFRTGAWPIPAEGLILGQPMLAKTLDRSFKRLQRAASAHLETMSRPRLYSLQSLRRLHGDQIDEVGYKLASGLVQESLQHSSGSVTAEHYKNSLERAILRLPEV
jgi:hypothetical protein